VSTAEQERTGRKLTNSRSLLVHLKHVKGILLLCMLSCEVHPARTVFKLPIVSELPIVSDNMVSLDRSIAIALGGCSRKFRSSRGEGGRDGFASCENKRDAAG